MSQCSLCGSREGTEQKYAVIRKESEPLNEYHGRSRVYRITETMTEILDASVCPRCAKRAKRNAVLKTVPIALAMTAALIFFSFFKARPGRNIRREVASLPALLPWIAAGVWLIGLTVYLPKPAALYGAERLRKEKGYPNDTFLVLLDPQYYTRRRDGSLSVSRLTDRTPLKTELADRLTDALAKNSDAQMLEALLNQPFTVCR